MNRLHITISMITIMQVLIMSQVMCKFGLILMVDSKLSLDRDSYSFNKNKTTISILCAILKT